MRACVCVCVRCYLQTPERYWRLERVCYWQSPCGASKQLVYLTVYLTVPDATSKSGEEGPGRVKVSLNGVYVGVA